MTYFQSKTLIEEMYNLEQYSKLYTFEFSKDDTDWDAVTRYTDNIEIAKRKIFDMMEDAAA